jgi:hypothetical protein
MTATAPGLDHGLGARFAVERCSDMAIGIERLNPRYSNAEPQIIRYAMK